MKKLLANVSNYAYNKMAKMAYYWYWLGVSSVCVKMPKISVAGEKNSSKSQATQCYPLFASLLGGWVGSYRSENQNLWAMFAIVKGPSTFRWLMLSTERIDKTDGWYWACANTIRQCIIGWWVGYNQKSEATTATQTIPTPRKRSSFNQNFWQVWDGCWLRDFRQQVIQFLLLTSITEY